jgi:hypothetical protein
MWENGQEHSPRHPLAILSKIGIRISNRPNRTSAELTLLGPMPDNRSWSGNVSMGRLFSKIGWIVFASCFAAAGVAVDADGQQAQPAAAAADQVPQAIREMQQVEDRWSTAVNKRDQYGLELVLSPQFIGVSATGDVTTRDQQIARLFVKEAEPVSVEQKVVSVRTIDNIAIVNGTYVMHWKLGSNPLDEKGVFSHVFEHTRGGWVCVNSQQTVVAEGGKAVVAKETKEKEKSKTSTAALPFHIPLIYKGPKSTQPEPAPGSDTPQN